MNFRTPSSQPTNTPADAHPALSPATPLQAAVRLFSTAFLIVRADEQAHEWLVEIAAVRVAQEYRRLLDRPAA